jgi:hypothetical protein
MTRIFELRQEEEILNSYQKLGLKSNPFPIGGAPLKDHPYVEISPKLTKEIVAFVDSVTATKKWQGLTIIGDNGTGKTRLLFSLENDINGQLKFANAIYVNDPPTDSIKFFQKIVSSCDFDRLTQDIVNAEKPTFINLFDKNLMKTTTLSGTKIAEIVDIKKLVMDFTNYIKDSISSDINIVKAYSVLIIHYIISNLLKEKGIEISPDDFLVSEIYEIKRFLTGEKIPDSVLANLGIKYVKIDTNYIEKVVFPAFLQYNKLADKKVVYALVDEFQFVIDNVSKAKIATLLDTIIAVAQSNPHGFCMVLSCLPDSWNYTTRISSSFLERFNKQLNMPNLSKEAAIKLTKEYLNYGRIEESDEIFPFDQDAIYKCLTVSQYNVRNFLQLMGTILNLFVKSNGQIIDIAFVRDTLKQIKSEIGLEIWTSED